VKTASPAQVGFIQGVQTPNVAVDPKAFAAYTRRMRFAALAPTAISPGSSTQVQLKKTGVVSALEVRVAGNVVVSGTIGTTTASYEWPRNILKGVKISVNGQSTLIDARGLDVNVAEYLSDRDINDRGVSQRYANATAVTQGTLSQSHEDWGATGAAANFIAPGLNTAATGPYPVDLTYVIPIALKQANLIGSVFGQSQATNINAEFIWGQATTAGATELFSAIGASAVISLAAVTFDVTAVAYSIPVVNGTTVVPDLSMLHGLNHWQIGVSASGETEYLLPGTGAGRSLCRVFYNIYNGGTPLTPLAHTATNITTCAYKYGANDVPETLVNGSKLRAINERAYGTDIGKNWGYGCWDFINQYAARDIIDLGQTSDFRVVIGLAATPAAGSVVHLTQETLFAANVGA
jgi:hypothetical protein